MVMKRLLASIAFGATALATSAFAQQKIEITFARFFGACDADYGSSQDFAKARGIVITPEIVEGRNSLFELKPETRPERRKESA